MTSTPFNSFNTINYPSSSLLLYNFQYFFTLRNLKLKRQLIHRDIIEGISNTIVQRY